jgi:peptidoglycan hydrolase-like protein with peptidoglycan-binding domain
VLRLWGVVVVGVAASALAAGSAPAAGTSDVAALQVALRAQGLYDGSVDGVAGPATARAIRGLQRRSRLTVDGVVGPQTRRALGRLGKPALGRRVLRARRRGWDVAEVQFLLAWHGFPSGTLDGDFGPRTEDAVRRFQRWASLAVDGQVGPATLAALRAPAAVSPLQLAWPVQAPVGDRFGPRGARFHAGVDLTAWSGVPVAAAAAGLVVFAGPRTGGWGNFVAIAHTRGVRTFYAHLSRVDVRLGEFVRAGTQIGLVGATGSATGPHLHFEVRVRGAAVDPLTALP